MLDFTPVPNVMYTTSPTSKTIRIYAGKLFDSEARTLQSNRLITVDPDSGLILSVDEYSPNALAFTVNENIIDLRHATVLPGFVDVHVHCQYINLLREGILEVLTRRFIL